MTTLPCTFPKPSAIVAIGGSAGALGPLTDVLAALPSDTSAALSVVMHVGQRSPGNLPAVLGRHCALPVHYAEDNAPVTAGQVYVAPPGRHLILSEGVFALSAGARVNRHRPAIDVTFASAAAVAGSSSAALILSGALDDGAVGAALVARAGGAVFVQHPDSAQFGSMPKAALAASPGACVGDPAELGAQLSAWMRSQVPDTVANSGNGKTDSTLHQLGTGMSMADSDDPGFLFPDESRLSRLSCPDCGGSMAEVQLPTISFYRCHVGHQYSPQTLAAAQAESTERRLWGAVAALEEQATLLRHLASQTPAPLTSAPVEAERVARRAHALRARVRSWSSDPDQESPAT